MAAQAIKGGTIGWCEFPKQGDTAVEDRIQKARLKARQGIERARDALTYSADQLKKYERLLEESDEDPILVLQWAANHLCSNVVANCHVDKLISLAVDCADADR